MFAGYETNKHDWHGYSETYERLMKGRRESAEAILEMGIDRGGSLRAFRDYFPNAIVIGFDINPETMVYNEDRIRSYVGNQRDRNALLNAARTVPTQFDLIVDDASHLPIDQYHALKVLWKFLKPGGFYVIEDLDLSRQTDVLTNCYILVGREAEMHVHPGRQTRNGDLLILEKNR